MNRRLRKEVGLVRIQHNITALNVYRNLNTNNSSIAKNLEKLSSGYRINRAGDDAAGLAVSEKMRAQITGLEQAVQNAEDGISLVQTVEGAMTEIHSMLNRMVELSVQSANGTYSGEERTMMNEEIQQLKTEITRIGNTSTFNSIRLFPNGGLSSTKEASVTTYHLTLDLKSRKVMCNKQELILQGKQFDLLEYLLNTQNIILTKDQIFDKIWGFDSETSTNVIEVYASRTSKRTKKSRI